MLILTTSRMSELKFDEYRMPMAVDEGQVVGRCPKCHGTVRIIPGATGKCDSCPRVYRVEFIAKLTKL